MSTIKIRRGILPGLALVWFFFAGTSAIFANIPGGGTGTGPNVTVVNNGDGTVTMGNGIVSVHIVESSATINQINYTYNNSGGTVTNQLLNGGTDGGELYWETGGFSSGTFNYSPVATGPSYGETDLLSTSTTNGTLDIHFSMLQGSPGFYVTAIWSHRSADVAMSMGETRDNIYAGSMFNWMCVDSRRNKLMEVSGGGAGGVFDAPVEVSIWTNGIYAGRYEDKYKYSADFGVERVWGWASVNASTGSGGLNVGLWNVLSSTEYYNGGPMKRELMSHIGTTILNMTKGGHYGGGQDASWAAGEVWTQCYGPWFIYCNNVTNTLTNPAQASTALYADAQAQAAAEATAWPYSWLTNANYAPATGRGAVSGQIVINDIYNTNASAAGLWVGVIQQPATTDGIYDFQDWMKCYQFWVKSDSNGNFTILNVVAGANYTLYAFGPGAEGMFMSQNQTGGNPDLTFNLPTTPFSVTVTGGATNNLGAVTWTPTRVGPTVFEIGYPNRTAEYKFRHGDDWWVGDIGPSANAPSPIWSKYFEYPFDFPNGVNYTVGQSRWTTDWNFCNPAVFTPSGSSTSSSSTINFNLASAPGSGTNGSFYMATASDFTGPIVVSVNGHNLGSTGGVTSTPNGNSSSGYNPNFSGGNDESDTTIREGIHGCYSDERITFPGSLLTAGSNTITILMNGTGSEDHIMYDYLRLELFGYVPPPPAAVTAYPGNNCNLLSWPVTPGATSYNLLRSTNSGSGYSAIATNITSPVCGSGWNNATYLDATALNGTTYYYVVQSVNPVSASANSAQSPATAPSPSRPMTAPAAPTGLAATVGHTNVSLTWNASTGANYYSIWRSILTDTGGGSSNVLSTNILNNTTTNTTFTDTAVTDGAYYNYFVTAANAGGTSPNSAAANATPVPPPPASAPAGFTVSTTQTSTNQRPALRWNPVSGALGYVIYRSTNSTGPFDFTHGFVMSVTETNYTDVIPLNTVFYYVVVAMNAGGVSAPSTVVSTGVVTPTSTTLALTAGTSPCTYGTSLTFQATISPAPPNGETVAFYSGATSIGTATTGGGLASLTLNNLPYSASAQSISATYAGDPNYGSSSAALSQTVNQATLTYVANPAFRPVGAANPAFSGTVTGFVNGETQAGATTGTLIFTTTATTASPAGSYPIDGAGLSAGNYAFAQAAGNASALTISSNSSSTTTTLDLAAGTSPCIYGTPLTFQATVSPAPPNGETVTFYSGAASIGTATTSGGVASLTLNNLPYGASAQSITATYVGDPNYGTSASTALSQTVNRATLTYVANPASRLVGAANPVFSGTVTNFVNGETQAGATTGTLVFTTTATPSSLAGSYAINGSGLSANNYIFVQAPGNATALTITGNGVATQIKAANTTALETGPSWIGGAAPGPGDIALWNAAATVTGDTLSSMGGAFSIGEIQIAGSVAGAVSITDPTTADMLALNGATGSGLAIDMSAATQNLTLGTPLTIGGSQTWDVASGTTFTINGVNNPQFGASVVTILGGGTVLYQPVSSPATTATSSPGAGLVVSNSTLAVALQGTTQATYNDVFGTNTALTLANSTFAASEIANSGKGIQTFTSLTLYPGTSLFQQAVRTANSGFSVGFSVINRYGGSMADFAPQGSGGRTFGNAATGYALAGSGVLGWATEGGNDWASALGAATFITLPTYVNDTWAAANDTTVTTSDSESAATCNSLRFNAAGAFTVTLSGANTITTGGILVGSGVGANAATITGGTLTSGNANADGTRDLIVIDNNATTGSSVVINSVIADNGGNSVGLTAGATAASPGGPIILGGANTFSGTSCITKGTLQLNVGSALQNSTFNTSLPGTLSFGALSAATLGGLGGTGNLALPSGFALIVGNNNSNTTFSGALSGAGATLMKTGTGTLTLEGTNTYTGATTIAGGTLGGTGVISGPVTVNVGGVLSPGDPLGTLTISNNLTLAAGSTTLMQVQHLPPTNNAVNVSGTFSAGGTLNVTNVGVLPLAAGDSFKLFSASTYSGSFTGFVLPPLTGSLVWNTNTLKNSGILSVVTLASPTISTFKLAGGKLVFNGSGGVNGWPFLLLGATNLAGPWTPVATNYFDSGGSFALTNAISPGSPQIFYKLQLQ